MKQALSIVFLLVIVLLTSTINGCVVPNLKPIKGIEETDAVKIGETSRDEIIKMLGHPNVAADDRMLVYNWEKSRFFWVIGGGYSAALGAAGHKGFRAMVLLDTNGRASDLITADSTDQPEQVQENWVPVHGCGIVQLPSAVALCPDDGLIVALTRNELCITDMDDPDSARRIDLGKVPQYPGMYGPFISTSRDHCAIAVAAGMKSPRIFDAADGSELMELGEPGELLKRRFRFPRPVRFSPDGKLLASSEIDGSLALWDASTGEELLRYHPDATPSAIEFSPDGRWLATGFNGGGFQVIETDSGSGIMSRPPVSTSSHPTAIAFSPDGELMAISTSVHLEIWSVATLERMESVLLPFYRHSPWYNLYTKSVVGFSPDSSTLAVFAHDTVSLLDSESADILGQYHFKRPQLGVAFDKDWSRVLLLSVNGMKIWEFPAQE